MAAQPPPTENASNDTPRIDALCLLESYTSSHSAASASAKTALWNLSRARRSRGGFHLGGGGSGGLSALDVREELRAKAVLKCSDLSQSDGSKPREVDLFTLYPDGLPAAANDSTDGNKELGAGGEHTGLRQRKNAPKGKKVENESVWTEETPELETEEERLKKSDPIDLFGGLPSPALRTAQTEARKALLSYVEAANLAAEILRIVNKEETSGRTT